MITIAMASLAGAGWDNGSGWHGPPWPALFLVPLIVAALFIVAVRARRGRPPGAVEIVAERYARGDIDEDEYRRRTAELRGNQRPPTKGS